MAILPCTDYSNNRLFYFVSDCWRVLGEPRHKDGGTQLALFSERA